MKTRSRLFVLAALSLPPLAILFACSSTSQPPILGDYEGGTPRDGSPVSDAKGDAKDAGDANTDGGPCTPLALSGTYITQQFVATDLPPPMGGTLVDGTYALTAAHDYTGPGGQTGPSATVFQETVVISGSSFVATILEMGGFPATEAYTFVVVTPDGGTPNSVLDLTLVCSPNPQAITRSKLGFTAAGKQLVISGGTIENVLTRP
jgi:hypothetical protein